MSRPENQRSWRIKNNLLWPHLYTPFLSLPRFLIFSESKYSSLYRDNNNNNLKYYLVIIRFRLFKPRWTWTHHRKSMYMVENDKDLYFNKKTHQNYNKTIIESIYYKCCYSNDIFCKMYTTNVCYSNICHQTNIDKAQVNNFRWHSLSLSAQIRNFEFFFSNYRFFLYQFLFPLSVHLRCHRLNRFLYICIHFKAFCNAVFESIRRTFFVFLIFISNLFDAHHLTSVRHSNNFPFECHMNFRTTSYLCVFDWCLFLKASIT